MKMIKYADTDEMREVSTELKALASELDGEINMLYSRLSEVPTISKEWVGSKAQLYFRLISYDKWQYINLSDHISRLGNEILREAKELETSISKDKR